MAEDGSSDASSPTTSSVISQLDALALNVKSLSGRMYSELEIETKPVRGYYTLLGPSPLSQVHRRSSSIITSSSAKKHTLAPAPCAMEKMAILTSDLSFPAPLLLQFGSHFKVARSKRSVMTPALQHRISSRNTLHWSLLNGKADIREVATLSSSLWAITMFAVTRAQLTRIVSKAKCSGTLRCVSRRCPPAH